MASSSRSAERFKYGICLNDECSLCKEKKVQQIPMRKDLVCSECGKPLRECPPPKKKGIDPKLIGIIAAVVIIGSGIAAFFGLKGGSKLPTEIKLEKNELLMTVGETYVIVPSAEPEGVKATFVFNSNSKNVEMTSGGEVTAKKKGEATVFVKCEENPEISAICKIIIQEKDITNPPKDTTMIEKISIDGKDFILKKGDKKQLKYIAVPEPNDENPLWESSDKAVATVSADGIVTAIKKGSAKITVKANNTTSIPLTVTVSESYVNPPSLSYGRYSGDRNSQGLPHGFGDIVFTKRKLVTGGTYAEPGYKIRNGRFVNGKLQSGTLYDIDGNKVCFVDANNNL